MNQQGPPPWGYPQNVAYNSNRTEGYRGNFTHRRGRKSRWGSPNKNDKKEGGSYPQRDTNCSSTQQYAGRGRSPWQNGRSLLGRPPRGSLLGRPPRGSVLGRPPHSGLPGRSPINCPTSRPFHSQCEEEEDENEISNWLKSNKDRQQPAILEDVSKDPLPGSEEERECSLKKATEALKQSLKNKMTVNLNKLLTEEEEKQSKANHALPPKVLTQPQNLFQLNLDSNDLRAIGCANTVNNDNNSDDEIIELTLPPLPKPDIIQIDDSPSKSSDFTEISPRQKKTPRKNLEVLKQNKSSEDRQNKIISDLQKITKNKLRDIINNPRSGKFDHAMRQLMKAQRAQISQKSREVAEKNLTNLKPTDEVVDDRTVLADLSIDWANLPTELINTLGDLFNFEEAASASLSPEPARCQGKWPNDAVTDIDIHEDFGIKLETISTDIKEDQGYQEEISHPTVRVRGFAREFTSECESGKAKNHLTFTTKEEHSIDPNKSPNKNFEKKVKSEVPKEKESTKENQLACPERNLNEKEKPQPKESEERVSPTLSNCESGKSTKEKQFIDLAEKSFNEKKKPQPKEIEERVSPTLSNCESGKSTKEKQFIDLAEKSFNEKKKPQPKENEERVSPTLSNCESGKSTKEKQSVDLAACVDKRVDETAKSILPQEKENSENASPVPSELTQSATVNIQTPIIMPIFCTPILAGSNKKNTNNLTTSQIQQRINEIDEKLKFLVMERYTLSETLAQRLSETSNMEMDVDDDELPLNKRRLSTVPNNQNRKKRRIEVELVDLDNNKTKSNQNTKSSSQEGKSKKKKEGVVSLKNKSSSSTPKSNGKVVEELKSKSIEKPSSPRDNVSQNGIQKEIIPIANNGTVAKECIPRMDGYILDLKVYKESYLACSQNGITYQNKIEKNQLFASYGDKSVPGLNCIDVMEDTLFTGGEDGFLKLYNIVQLGANETKFNIKPQKILNLSKAISVITCEWGTAYVGTKAGSICPFILKTEKLAETITLEGSAVLAIKSHKEGPRKVIIISCRNQPITIRDAESGLLLRQFGTMQQTVYCLNLHDNLLFCGTDGNHILVYDFQGGILKYKLSTGKGIVNIVQVDEVLFAGSYDGNIYVFDVQEQKGLITLRGPGKMILCISVINKKLYCSSKNCSTLMVTDLSVKIKSAMDKNRKLKGIL
ncbi:uncharacterized protein LOC113203761 isoform X1 [Frankliniella occidentalis]|uniref:Uncharacterized protein LOC113203761 isoform X1 n=1 Tax=Frankliniella occidentalis TaxID=133901 RepID=A0A9C6X2K8_FRAOC|nr:uncharacterized protein LOC113203761 isoform X1 [Frankliniella occidentalis]XP_052128013.1 uncharacterized protein LOC113203761 isoform X1 [Frankliniella occidentalis]XP_052128015.1 uncharacterized protein LOC113203761 isoform X1 [Frankliniella occidentalis]XP_052128016.1 uncharacterized protein LOC113203761 isoform X1 [Frankliniella occidentalis]